MMSELPERGKDGLRRDEDGYVVLAGPCTCGSISACDDPDSCVFAGPDQLGKDISERLAANQ